MIRGLRIIQQTQSTCTDFNIVMETDRRRASLSHAYPRFVGEPHDLSILRHFHSLEELHLEFEARSDDSKTLTFNFQCSADFFNAVLAIAEDLKSLKMIVMQTTLYHSILSPGRRPMLEAADRRGWTCYVSLKGWNKDDGLCLRNLEMLRRT